MFPPSHKLLLQAKIDKPYNAENAAIHRKVLEDSNAAFIVVKKGFFETDLPKISEVSDSFLELTEFTLEECIEKSWDVLQAHSVQHQRFVSVVVVQGRDTDPTRWASLALCLATGDSRLEMMKVPNMPAVLC